MFKLLKIVTIPLLIGTAYLSCSDKSSQNITKEAVVQEPLEYNKFVKLIGDESVIIIDVRTPEEYSSGHIAKALLIDINNPDFAQNIGTLDKKKSYALYCRTHNRSTKALEFMKANGFKEVYHLKNGFTELVKQNHPLVNERK